LNIEYKTHKMKKGKLITIVAIVCICYISSGCRATMHTVGTGGKGDCKTVGQYDAQKKRWYLFWGWLPLNKVDAKALAGGYENYTVRTTTSVGDFLIALVTSPILPTFGGFVRTQTVRVSKGDK
jgi:hypothetical protein